MWRAMFNLRSFPTLVFLLLLIVPFCGAEKSSDAVNDTVNDTVNDAVNDAVNDTVNDAVSDAVNDAGNMCSMYDVCGLSDVGKLPLFCAEPRPAIAYNVCIFYLTLSLIHHLKPANSSILSLRMHFIKKLSNSVVRTLPRPPSSVAVNSNLMGWSRT